jgi:hypothetical protein
MSIPAVIFGLATIVVATFQLALAAGAPWGEYAMGGRVPGRFPPAMRVAAVVQAVMLGALAFVVLDKAGVVTLGWTASLGWLAWLPVAVSLLSAVMNAATRSRVERRLWFPVAVVMLLSSIVVAVA